MYGFTLVCHHRQFMKAIEIVLSDGRMQVISIALKFRSLFIDFISSS